jgi:ribosome-binding factor A
MTEPRHLKVEAQLQRVLAELVSREVKDPRVGNVTITGVEVAADLKSARVYFVPFGSAHGVAEVREGLTHAGGFLRGQVARRLALRYAPRLSFVFDESIDRAEHLTHLISSALEPRKPGC